MDPETEFLASKQETGNEWELFKENVRPLKRGRNVGLLNQALKSHSDYQLKRSLLDTRRKLVEAIDEYEGDDPLLPWIECIKWVQEAFPQGGDSSGLVLVYEQCVRAFWHSDRYKDDLRYLKVWLEYVGSYFSFSILFTIYLCFQIFWRLFVVMKTVLRFFCQAENCVDAEVIYSFLDANEIGKSHSAYYLAYALHMESKSKMKIANDIFNLGISRDAQPIEKLKDAYRKFLIGSMRKPKVVEDDGGESHLPVRSFGTVLSSADNRRQNMERSELANKQMKPDRTQKTPLSIFKDTTNIDAMPGRQSVKAKPELNPWSTLGAREERNKENSAVPTKWTTYKIPQRPGARAGGVTASASIEVFVDEECSEMVRAHDHDGMSSTLKLRQGGGLDIKKETDLLRENPLRNFPLRSLPR
nr:mitotic spindle checkpoint protein BUBR1-like isoform X1 [Populus alba]XP_034905420.1 mitotic spindle checkpoint protein BUBR1-like isoform X1 [Populus alba]XP_034905421.1 mitotic spindle checkpoint protein BUBR1-like isoform X1 [Populus alba]XP_034905422.1 mitotic spindle checkpoint protein BUBR1-like isoform X1 [Populus alba]XP_034905423.1 mitotic spindle checkpoint protein BUBR1-like isoform X1 [Populus alba]